MDTAIQLRRPWNKGLIVGQKRPLLPRQVWSIRVRLEMSASARDLALFNLAIDSKLRASDLVRLKVDVVCSGRLVRDRGVVIQKKTGRPVQFEITEVTRQSVERLLAGISYHGRSPCPRSMEVKANWTAAFGQYSA